MQPVWNRKSRLGQDGYTLLEMLVVISILVAVAAVGTGTFSQVRVQADDRMAYTEMSEIARAVRRFKQDTGYYPKEGPFALEIDGGAVPYDALPDHVVDAYGSGEYGPLRRWFYSPANFYQLLSLESPLVGTGHLLEDWNPETGRGWRGPYLNGFGERYLDIRDGINDGTFQGNPEGDPVEGINIPNVEGIADTFEHRPVNVDGNTLLDWSWTPDGREREAWGRPYLLFLVDGASCLVSMGPDGDYGTDDDIELYLE